jgi:hypothetical protein
MNIEQVPRNGWLVILRVGAHLMAPVGLGHAVARSAGSEYDHEHGTRLSGREGERGLELARRAARARGAASCRGAGRGCAFRDCSQAEGRRCRCIRR